MSRPVYPELTPGVPRKTQSEIETLLRCGERRRLEMESKHRHATVKMVTGSAVGEGAKCDNRAKAAGGEGLPLVEIIERSVAGYERELERSEISDSKLEQDAGKDDAANAARVYGLRVSPLVREVMFAEDPIVADVGGMELAGTPDVITSDGVGDLKTGRAWDQADADGSRQLGFYGLLHKARTGEFPRRLWIDSIFRTAKGWNSQRLWTRRTGEQYAALLLVAEAAVKAEAAGVFLPAPEGAWWCSKIYCPFHSRGCRYFGGASIR